MTEAGADRRNTPRVERRSIQRQIMSAGIRMTTLTLLLLALLMDGHVIYKRLQELRQALDTQASIAAASSVAVVQFQNTGEAQEILSYLRASSDVTHARIFLADGRVLSDYQREPGADSCHDIQPRAGPSVAYAWCGLVKYQPVELHDRVIGTVALEMSLASTYEQLLTTLVFTALVVLLAIAITVPVWRRLAIRLTYPLTELVRVTREVGITHNFALRSNATGSQEAQALAHGFNRMMAELQERDGQLNQELRQRRQAEVRLNDLAYFDNVTGLHNRHYFKERIEGAAQEALATGRSCGLLYIDLDGFKQVNDTLGHDRGDDLLRQVAERLKRTLPPEHDICRLGGDEFAVISQLGTPEDELQAAAAQLVQTIARPYALGDRTAFVSASIGGCVFPDHAADSEAWLRNADSAMYQVKARGRNGFKLFHQSDAADISRTQQLEQELRLALGDRQLHLVYQPRVQMATGEIVGVEALLRWQHPTFGLVSPSDFIPLAEASGLIVPIGRWMLEESITQLQQWRETSPHMQVSVNISARQLESEEILDDIIDLFKRSKLPPRCIDLELTETLFVDRSETMLARLRRLRDAGFGLAIDDFGIGYSSLAYLDSFPITTIKIDRAFVQGLGDTPRGKAIARAIVAIGQALKVEVVAEGIETREQADILLQLGCRRGQGFFFAPPLSADILTEGLHTPLMR